jgi:hypothetical protein
MPLNFTLHEDAWFRNQLDLSSGRVTGYRVGGMPDGRIARIANFGAPNRDDWRVMIINADKTYTDWSGNYENAEDALAALQGDSSENALT